MSIGDQFHYVQQGWQCPCCKRVYSPTTSMCMYCGNGESYVSTGTTFKPMFCTCHTEQERKLCMKKNCVKVEAL